MPTPIFLTTPPGRFTMRDLGDLLHYLDLHPTDTQAIKLREEVAAHLGKNSDLTEKLARRLKAMRSEEQGSTPEPTRSAR